MIIIIIYSLIIFYIIVEGIYFTIKPLNNIKKIRYIHISNSILVSAVPFYLNRGHINLFSFLISFSLISFISFGLSYDIVVNFCNSSTTYCAGIQKLIEMSDSNVDEYQEIADSSLLYSDFIRSLNQYHKNNNFKTISKFHFDFILGQKRLIQDFRLNVETLKKLDLNFDMIRHYNKELLTLLKCETGISVEKTINLVQLLENYHFENSFKIKSIVLTNEKFGIPFYAYYTSLDKIAMSIVMSIKQPQIVQDFSLNMNDTNNFLLYEVLKYLDTNEKKNFPFFFNNYEKYETIFWYNNYINSMLKTLSFLDMINIQIENSINIILSDLNKNGLTTIENNNLELNIPSDKSLQEHHGFNNSLQNNEICDVVKVKKICDYKFKILLNKNIKDNILIKNRFNKMNYVFLKELKSDNKMLKDLVTQKNSMIIYHSKILDSDNSLLTNELKLKILQDQKNFVQNKKPRLK